MQIDRYHVFYFNKYVMAIIIFNIKILNLKNLEKGKRTAELCSCAFIISVAVIKKKKNLERITHNRNNENQKPSYETNSIS